MTLPTAPTTKGKSLLTSAFFIDIATAGTDASFTWTRLFGIKSITPSGDITLVDNSDFDDVDQSTGMASQSQVPVSESWGLEVGLSSKDYGTSTFTRDPGQAYLEDNSGKRVRVRWYRRNGSGKVKQGYAYVKFQPTDNSGVLNGTATFTGDGKLDKATDASTIITP